MIQLYEYEYMNILYHKCDNLFKISSSYLHIKFFMKHNMYRKYSTTSTYDQIAFWKSIIIQYWLRTIWNGNLLKDIGGIRTRENSIRSFWVNMLSVVTSQPNKFWASLIIFALCGHANCLSSILSYKHWSWHL